MEGQPKKFKIAHQVLSCAVSCVSHQPQDLLMHFLEVLVYESFTLENFLKGV